MSTLDMTCSCGATMHYVGDLVISQRGAFLAAHEPCRTAFTRSNAHVGLTIVDAPAVHRSLLKLKRRNGGRSLGLA